MKTKKNIKWVAELGSQSYGNPVVAEGMVFVGTNNELLRDPKQGGDRGVLMAFRESDGEFLWQQTHAKLEAGSRQRLAVTRASPRRHWSKASVSTTSAIAASCSASTSTGSATTRTTARSWTRSSRVSSTPTSIWSFDMIEEVGSYPHNMSNSSPVVHGDSDLS